MDTSQYDESADPDVVAREPGRGTLERSFAVQHEPSERLADDVLLGAKCIAEHLTAILGKPVGEADVYYAHRMRKWPIGKYGALLIASKRRFARHVEKITRGAPAT